MFKKILKQFLLGEKLSEESEQILVLTIKKQVFFAINSVGFSAVKNIFSQERLEDEILNETIIRLIEKKKTIISKLENSPNIEVYIRLMVKNWLIDRLRNKTIKSYELNEKYLNRKDYKKDFLKIEAMELAKTCDEVLTPAEKEALCYELSNIKPPKKSKASFEKAKSRAHKRLRELMIKEKFSKEVVEVLLKNFFMSEICKEFVDIKKRK